MTPDQDRQKTLRLGKRAVKRGAAARRRFEGGVPAMPSPPVLVLGANPVSQALLPLLATLAPSGGGGEAGDKAPAPLSLVLADADLDRARELAAQVRPRIADGAVETELACAQLDPDDPKALAAALGPCRLAINCLGDDRAPALLEAVLQASSEGPVAYLDPCSCRTRLEAMLALDGHARDGGASALVGMGIAPGLSSLLAEKALGEMRRRRTPPQRLDLVRDMQPLLHPAGEPCQVLLRNMLTGLAADAAGGKRGWLAGRKPDAMRPQRAQIPGFGRHRLYLSPCPESLTLGLPGHGCRSLTALHPADAAALRRLAGSLHRGETQPDAATAELAAVLRGRRDAPLPELLRREWLALAQLARRRWNGPPDLAASRPLPWVLAAAHASTGERSLAWLTRPQGLDQACGTAAVLAAGAAALLRGTPSTGVMTADQLGPADALLAEFQRCCELAGARPALETIPP